MERLIHDAIDGLVPWVEAVGALFVLGGVVTALARVIWVPFMRERPPLAAIQIRTGLGLALALGLEFQLAGDILRTAVSPTYHEVALLASIAAIRTLLNYFLNREFVEGRRQIETLREFNHRATGPPSMRHRAQASGRSEPHLADVVRSAILGPLWSNHTGSRENEPGSSN